ncbi:riboflavin biosynthesis protein RibF [Anaeromyxobacter diazotrophicus]|uniref:Riboflavin biosynthesis protein n=1 Tax=Anaeromyxobacter diazotrophicus TaxID=2590199 RepID=A0A7I9VHE0_9BACT|nr:riboflavin biosynthesis protein RibF [Anaeromyxobacter diazotrophicus]GEJ55669.1 riboflavin biosynthesis protein [Anaeromyxobacter diazotrophicus]
MEVYRSLAEAGALRGCAVAVGNFDGVHLGHRRLFEVARELSAARGAPAAALTFEPHPVRVLRPQLAPPLLTPLARKLELLAGCALDAAVVQPFDLAYAATDAEAFVARDLVGHLGARDVVVGQDFTAGRGRTRVDRLRELLAAHGARLTVVEPVAWEGLVVSSTKIRELLLEGQVEAAAPLLGRPHDVEGPVERGAGRGRGLGFATANLRPQAMLPANGVYAVRAWSGGAELAGVANVGVKPTVQRSGTVSLEAHLLDADARDRYGEPLRVAFVARLREERRFASLEALREQIAEDAERARAVLSGAGTM